MIAGGRARKSGSPQIVVLGSVNLDIVASAPRLPVPGETITGAELNRYPGGKGANQALAARRLGADVVLCARVGQDAAADEALALLRTEGVELSFCKAEAEYPTGTALIVVAGSGENQIVVAPGANSALRPETLELPAADALICQLEVPTDTIAKAAAVFEGFFCINLAPAAPVPRTIIQRADLIVMNETEAAFMGDAVNDCAGMIAITHGAEEAVLSCQGETLARARPPSIQAVDTTGAGDTFTAALVVRLIQGFEPADALAFACAAGAFTATRHGAQPSFPCLDDVESLLG